jgi:tetratricopeptide (TPR) repeat protein
MIWLCAHLLFASTALAQGDASDEEARARFQSGRFAYNSGRFEEALRDFQRAYELSNRPLILYNVGLAYERLDMLPEAIESFRGFLVQMPDAPNRGEVESRIEVLQRRLEAPPPPEDGGGGGILFTWFGLGATAALTGVAVGLWVSANSIYDDLELECLPAGCTRERIDDSGAPGLVTLTNVFLVSSLVAAAATAAIFTFELLSSGDDAPAATVGLGLGSIRARLDL